jgi:hypothetical protein
MAAMGVVPTLEEFEDGHARFNLGFEAAAVERFTFERGEETLAHRVIEQSPTEPIEGRTPAARQRWPKASAVYWLPCPNDESRRQADAAIAPG